MYLRERVKTLNYLAVMLGSIGIVSISIASGSVFLALGLSLIAVLSLLLRQKFPDKDSLYSIEVRDFRVTLKLGHGVLWHLNIDDIESVETTCSCNGAIIKEVTLKTENDGYVLPRLEHFERTEVAELVKLLQTSKKRA
ncbi:hypothetical protein [Vibrio vulnificus]|uniref:hypothetical protein n=1 Tax=Vibrio vulnificus TaxID=672 RepID=UPI001594A017|nr:hypothetical protein [Vibrio vulnificus]NVD22987.1 hypothetical protein [Vibrio vulnificus]